MTIVNPKLNAASIAVKKYLYDILINDASYKAQIPNRYKGFQTKPQPYFIFEENLLVTIIAELREGEYKQSKPNKEKIKDCTDILSLIQKEKLTLIFISLTA